jgi:hypothetical protein
MDEYYAPQEHNDDDVYWDTIHQIVDEEEPFWDTEKSHGNYYIGIAKVIRREVLMSNSMSLPTFYKYDISTLTDYLRLHSDFPYNTTPRIHLIQLCIENGFYKAVIKTFWLRIIQRTWKRIYKEKMRVVIARGIPTTQHYFATHGKYPCGLNRLPGLAGMITRLPYLSKDSKYKN